MTVCIGCQGETAITLALFEKWQEMFCMQYPIDRSYRVHVSQNKVYDDHVGSTGSSQYVSDKRGSKPTFGGSLTLGGPRQEPLDKCWVHALISTLYDQQGILEAYSPPTDAPLSDHHVQFPSTRQRRQHTWVIRSVLMEYLYIYVYQHPTHRPLYSFPDQRFKDGYF